VEELGRFLTNHTSRGIQSAADLADGIARLLALHCSYLKETPTMIGSIMPGHHFPGRDPANELDWTIQAEPDATGFNGRHVLTGGLVRNDNGTWSIHT
jgi:hypothetical protein